MSEGYWEQVGDVHHIDLSVLRSLAFRLLCIVEASRGLVRNLDAVAAEREEEGEELGDEDCLLVRLHDEMLVPESSKLLLQLAIMLRVYDDQMKNGPSADDYTEHLTKHNGNGYIGSTDDQERFNHRDACNKIIHATKFNFQRELYEREFGEKDFAFEITTGELELMGIRGKDSWQATLFLAPFIETILAVVEFGYPASDAPDEEATEG